MLESSLEMIIISSLGVLIALLMSNKPITPNFCGWIAIIVLVLSFVTLRSFDGLSVKQVPIAQAKSMATTTEPQTMSNYDL